MTAPARPHPHVADAASLVCSVCGYGIARPASPSHCPMCGTRDGWRHFRWQPFGRTAEEPLHGPSAAARA